MGKENYVSRISARQLLDHAAENGYGIQRLMSITGTSYGDGSGEMKLVAGDYASICRCA